MTKSAAYPTSVAPVPARRAASTRRQLLGAALLATTTGLTGCQRDQPGSAPGPSGSSSRATTVSPSPSSSPTPGNPLGIASGTKVELLVREQEVGSEAFKPLADRLAASSPELTLHVATNSDLTSEFVRRRDGGKLPDLIDLGGDTSPAWLALSPSLMPLGELLKTVDEQGRPLSSGFDPALLAAGVLGGRQLVLPTARCASGMWFSQRQFSRFGWVAPRTWAQALVLGQAARRHDLYLFSWCPSDAPRYVDLVVGSAVKQGGPGVLEAFERLDERCWRAPSVQSALTGLKALVDNHLLRPDGIGSNRGDALKHWLEEQSVLLRPDGAWLARSIVEKDQQNLFLPGLVGDLASDARPAMGRDALRLEPGLPLAVPLDAPNRLGAQECLRRLLQRDAAIDFVERCHVPSMVDELPESRERSAALAAQLEAIRSAGKQTYHWTFVARHALARDLGVLMSAFLDGQLDVVTITRELQALTDMVRVDPGARALPTNKQG